MPPKVEVKLPVSYERKRIEKRIVYDPKEFPPCHGKECEEWSHAKMKNEKYLIHVDKNGRFTRRKLT